MDMNTMNDMNNERKEVDEIACRGLFKLMVESEDFKDSLQNLTFTEPNCMTVPLETVMPKLDERLTFTEHMRNGYEAEASMLYGAVTLDGTDPDDTSRIDGYYLGGYEIAVYHAGLVDDDDAEEEVGIYAKMYFFLNDEDWSADSPEGQVEHEGYCICSVGEFLNAEPPARDDYMACVLEGAATVFYTNVLETLIQLRMAEEFE
jgi:hypothetical protein